jgi:hypothetical protein
MRTTSGPSAESQHTSSPTCAPKTAIPIGLSTDTLGDCASDNEFFDTMADI